MCNYGIVSNCTLYIDNCTLFSFPALSSNAVVAQMRMVVRNFVIIVILKFLRDYIGTYYFNDFVYLVQVVYQI